jgi:hypothetical protein
VIITSQKKYLIPTNFNLLLHARARLRSIQEFHRNPGFFAPRQIRVSQNLNFWEFSHDQESRDLTGCGNIYSKYRREAAEKLDLVSKVALFR